MFMLPFVAKALSISLTISFKGDVKLYDKIAVTRSINGNIETEYIKYNEKISKPADPQIDGYEFLGWYDGLSDSATKYTEYSGNQDLNLYAHWLDNMEHINTYFPESEPYNGAVITIDKGESYTLPNVLTKNDKYNVTFKYQDGVTADKTDEVVYGTFDV